MLCERSEKKMKTKIGLIAGTILLVSAEHSLSAAVISGPIVSPINGHSYYLLTQNTWTGSEAEAEFLGGHLATVRSDAESQWIYSTLSSFGDIARHLWIGLNDVSLEGRFVWVSGESVGYTNWLLGQPDNNGGVEDYVHMEAPFALGPGKWNDLDNVGTSATPRPFGVVEIIPEPSPIALFGLTPLALFRRRRDR